MGAWGSIVDSWSKLNFFAANRSRSRLTLSFEVMMLYPTTRRSASQSVRVLVAMVCVLLILFVGAAQALHAHAPDEAANPGCSLCAVAHVSALVTPVLASLPVLESVLAVSPVESPSVARCFFTFSLYVRPPPVLAAHA
jgi:hypothetical protein